VVNVADPWAGRGIWGKKSRGDESSFKPFARREVMAQHVAGRRDSKGQELVDADPLLEQRKK